MKPLLNFLFVGLFFSCPVFAQSKKLLSLQNIEWSKQEAHFRGSVTLEGVGIAGVEGNERTAVGYGLGTALGYGISKYWGVALGIRQVCYAGGVSPMFTMLEMKGTYSLSGNQIHEKTRISIDASNVVTAASQTTGGFQLQGNLSQFFFSADSAVIQLTGVGAGLVYDFETTGALNYQVGVRGDILFNRIFVFVPFGAFFGISYWL